MKASEAAAEILLASFGKAACVEYSWGTTAFTDSMSTCQHMLDIGLRII